jgi:hypothetical protein
MVFLRFVVGVPHIRRSSPTGFKKTIFDDPAKKLNPFGVVLRIWIANIVV